MKKTIFFVALFAAIVSFGGKMILTHADDLTPTDKAALQQSLDVMKAKLVNLEMQAGSIPQGDSGTGTSMTQVLVQPDMQASVQPGQMALSAQDTAAIQSALEALKVALVGLQSEVASNPDMATAKGPIVIATLQGIGNTLATIGTVIQGGDMTPTTGTITPQGIAAAPQISPSPSQSFPAMPSVNNPVAQSQTGNGMIPSTPGTVGVVNTTEPAQTASIWVTMKNNWPLIAITVLVIIAIFLWFSRDDEQRFAVETIPSIPIRPTETSRQGIFSSAVSNQEKTVSPQQVPMGNYAPPATPLSAAVSAPMQKSDIQVVRTIPSSVSDPKRKPA